MNKEDECRIKRQDRDNRCVSMMLDGAFGVYEKDELLLEAGLASHLCQYLLEAYG